MTAELPVFFAWAPRSEREDDAKGRHAVDARRAAEDFAAEFFGGDTPFEVTVKVRDNLSRVEQYRVTPMWEVRYEARRTE